MIRKNVNVPQEIHDQIDRYCKKMNMNFTSFIILASTQYLQNNAMTEKLNALFLDVLQKELGKKD